METHGLNTHRWAQRLSIKGGFMKDKLSIRFFIFIAILAAVVLFEYGPSFHFYFVGDDFVFIESLVKNKAAILWKSTSFYHYYPLGVLINALPTAFGSTEPVWFGLVNFLLFLACSILVINMYRNVAGGLTQSFAAALIYSTAIPNSEVIYWKTGSQTISMALFSLLALTLFMRFLRNGSRSAFLGCLMAFAASMLSIEQGVVTFGTLALYDVLFYSLPQLRAGGNAWKHTAIRFVGRMAVLAVVPLFLTVLKLSLDLKLSPFPSSSLPIRIFSSLPAQTAAKLVDFNNILLPVYASASEYFAVSVLSVVLLLYVLLKRSPVGLFFLLASLGPLMVISITAGGPNARYFCLPLAFYACFLSFLVNDISRAIEGILIRTSPKSTVGPGLSSRNAGLCQRAIYFGACLATVLVGLRGTLARRDFWASASLIERNIVESVEDLYLGGTPTGKVYLLDVPDFFMTEKYSVFYVCSNSLMPDLRYRLGDDVAGRIELASTNDLFEISLRGERVIYRALGRDKKMAIFNIKNLLESGNLVLRFSPSTMSIAPVYPP